MNDNSRESKRTYLCSCCAYAAADLGVDSEKPMQTLSVEALPYVAAYFQVLAEPSRLHILNLLRESEYSVGELAEAIGSSAANTSRHLANMAQHGFVERQTRGNSVYYVIADPSVYELCELVCGTLAERFKKVEAERANAFSALTGPDEKDANS